MRDSGTTWRIAAFDTGSKEWPIQTPLTIHHPSDDPVIVKLIEETAVRYGVKLERV